MPKRIQYRFGMVLPENSVYVGRPMPNQPETQNSVWGNPYRVEGRYTAFICCIDYLGHLEACLLRDPNWLKPLKGRDLACWCPLYNKDGSYNRNCHVEVILEWFRNHPEY